MWVYLCYIVAHSHLGASGSQYVHVYSYYQHIEAIGNK